MPDVSSRAITGSLSSQRRGRALFVGAVILLIFAVTQTIQFAQFTRTSDEAKAQSMPIDIVIMCLLSLIIGAKGAVDWSGQFKLIKSHEHFNNKRYDNIILRDDAGFAMFNDRGNVLAKLTGSGAGIDDAPDAQSTTSRHKSE